MESYLARICWNHSGWIQPTGEAARAEAGTYVTRSGFGHEEWVFAMQWLLHGWKYAFLQPVNRSHARVEGHRLNLHLYTIKPPHQWFYVAQIHECEVLNEQQAELARREYRRRGWLRDMKAQVTRIGGDVNGLMYPEALMMFNVRFKQLNAEIYDPMVPALEADAIHKYRRYNLVAIEHADTQVSKEWASRVGTTHLRPTGKQVRAGIPEREVDLVHNQLQNELFEVLCARFGAKAVVMEDAFADVKVRLPKDEAILFEVKTDPRPRHAIRTAIGQLLDYGYVSRERGETVRQIVVAAPGALRESDAAYLRYLRKERHLNVAYLQLRRGDIDLDSIL